MAVVMIKVGVIGAVTMVSSNGAGVGGVEGAIMTVTMAAALITVM